MKNTINVLGIIGTVGMLALSSINGFAGELDHEGAVTNVDQQAHAAELPQTLVVRVNTQDQSVAVLHSREAIQPGAESEAYLAHAEFTPANVKETVKGELDRDTSTNSWYFGFNFSWGRPYYSYCGYNYNYRPYYSYGYGYYYYYYYRW